jgi:hypothetical protein
MLSAVASRMADAVARIDRYQEAARNGRSVAQVNAAMAVRSLVWVAIAGRRLPRARLRPARARPTGNLTRSKLRAGAHTADAVITRDPH